MFWVKIIPGIFTLILAMLTLCRVFWSKDDWKATVIKEKKYINEQKTFTKDWSHARVRYAFALGCEHLSTLSEQIGSCAIAFVVLTVVGLVIIIVVFTAVQHGDFTQTSSAQHSSQTTAPTPSSPPPAALPHGPLQPADSKPAPLPQPEGPSKSEPGPAKGPALIAAPSPNAAQLEGIYKLILGCQLVLLILVFAALFLQFSSDIIVRALKACRDDP